MKLNRAKALGLLFFVALAIGAVSALPAVAAAPPSENATGTVPAAPEAPEEGTAPLPTEPPETEVNHEPESPEEATGSPLGVMPLDSNCFANDVCVWKGSSYTGERKVAECDGNFHNFSYGDIFYSVKNRCGGRRNWLVRQTESLENIYTICLNPGEEWAAPGWFNAVNVGPYPSSC